MPIVSKPRTAGGHLAGGSAQHVREAVK
jgi:hypothetical protein